LRNTLCSNTIRLASKCLHTNWHLYPALVNWRNFFVSALVFAKNSKTALLLQKIVEIPYFSDFLVPLHLGLRGTLKSDEILSLLYPSTWTCGVFFFFFQKF